MYHKMTLSVAINNYLHNISEWDQRYGNYNMKCFLKFGKEEGRRNSEYYSGWSTYVKLAQGKYPLLNGTYL